MTDIPLKSIKRSQLSRAGYSQLESDERDDLTNGHANGSADMPPSLRPASSAFISRKARGKRRADLDRGGYTDDAEEERTLLVDHEREVDEDELERGTHSSFASVVSGTAIRL